MIIDLKAPFFVSDDNQLNDFNNSDANISFINFNNKCQHINKNMKNNKNINKDQNNIPLKDIIILDSGSTSLILAQKKFFDKFLLLNNEYIMLGNGNHCEK